MRLLTAGGLAYVLIGSIAGALLAAAGPRLIADYPSASAEGRELARGVLEAFGNAALVGLWGTLELIWRRPRRPSLDPSATLPLIADTSTARAGAT